MKKNRTARNLLMLQAVVMLYTMATVVGKFASQAEGAVFFLLYGAEIGILGLYAIFWQQIIKRFELSIAYANRATALLWSFLWAVLIFGERPTVKKALGIALILAGTCIVNSGKGGTEIEK